VKNGLQKGVSFKIGHGPVVLDGSYDTIQSRQFVGPFYLGEQYGLEGPHNKFINGDCQHAIDFLAKVPENLDDATKMFDSACPAVDALGM
jgi:hypothetical protein